MSKLSKKSAAFIISFILFLTPVINLAGVVGLAADFDKINDSDAFLKQETSITCTLASAAMMLRRTAIAADYADWRDITEKNIHYKGWIEGVGLRWYFSSFGMTVSHGYFPDEDKKTAVIELLNDYPQGIVIYNGGSQGQNHAVFLCDYDETNDIFYVSDPANNAPEGRIKLEESTIAGETQDEQIENLTAYWFVKDPLVEYADGNYSADSDSIVPEKDISELYDPTEDVSTFDSTKIRVMGYYVVTDSTDTGAALRNYPSGNSTVYDYVKKGTVLFLTYNGQNKFGAQWFKTISGKYIFSSNIVPYDEYSHETRQYSLNEVVSKGTYAVKQQDRSQPVALRIEPSEGNNIAAYINDGHLVYVVSEGLNSVGARWFKTEDGYYIKAAETEFVKAEKDPSAGFSGTQIIISGMYDSQPVKDIVVDNSETAYYQITASTLNIRKSPVDGDVIGYLSKGEYIKIIAVKNGWGKMIFDGAEAWISLNYAVKVNVENIPIEIKNITLSADKITSGSKIKCSVNLSDGNQYTYKYKLHKVDGNSVNLHGDAITSSSFECTVSGAGYYYFRVDVTDAFGRSVYGHSSNFLVYDKLELSSVKCNSDKTAYTGDTVVWTADASAVSPKAVYNYSLYVDGELVNKVSSVSNEYFCVPEKVGKYKLEVYISDDYSESSKVTSAVINVYKKLSVDSVSVNKTTALTGSEITCNIKVSGGTGKCSYYFSLFNGGKLVENRTANTGEMSVTLSQSGSYKFFCTIVDSSGNSMSAVSADVNVFDMIKGDVDGDAKVTAKDARFALRHAALLDRLDDKGVAAADVDGDGKVSAGDARSILRYSANIITSFD